jgi:hypothetical protein
MNEDAAEKDRNRNQNGRNTQRVAEAVRGILMAGRVLRDPLLMGAIAQHGTASYINPRNTSFRSGQFVRSDHSGRSRTKEILEVRLVEAASLRVLASLVLARDVGLACLLQ